MDNFTYMLAPIEFYTGPAFRTICHKYGADITFTEQSRVFAMARNNKVAIERIRQCDETPTVIQLLGVRLDDFAKFISAFEPKKGFLGFNLNLGCPNPNIIAIGQGCAMIKRISRVKEIVKLIYDRGYKASIKTRLGLNEFEKQRKVYLNLIREVDAEFFVVHARHGMQGLKEKADFRVYPECVKTGKAIIANGDIKTKEQVEKLKAIGVKGVMIGRAALDEPGIFNMLKGINSPSREEIIKEYSALAERFNENEKYRKNISRWQEEKTAKIFKYEKR